MCNNERNDFEQLEKKVIKWADDKGITKPDNSNKQLLKCMSELGELADAEIENDAAEIVDGIGDTIVTLIIYANQKGLSITSCLNYAYNEIKDRTGETVDGVFIKDEV